MALGRTRELRVLIVGDASSAQRALRGLDTSVGKSAGRVRNFATRYGAAIGASLVGATGYAIKAAAEAEKVTAQTEAALKSTGGVANVTSEEIQALAEEIMNYSGQSDEAVQSAANMVLTFKNIRNETGANNDIFNQTTKAIVDMSVAMDKDLNSSAIMVGKALNDPIAGISAMGRAGVQFSEEQKEMIASLVETGNLLGAQKIILKEIESQFGDSAKAAGETTAGQYAILREKVDNLAEALGKNLTPALIEAADAGTYLLEELPKDIGSFWDTLEEKDVVAALEASAPLAAQFANQLEAGILTAQEYSEKIDQVVTSLREEGAATQHVNDAKAIEERIRTAAASALARYNTASSRSISSIEGQVAAVARLNAQHLRLISNLREIERLGIPGALVGGVGYPYRDTSGGNTNTRNGRTRRPPKPDELGEDF